jgi:hypothetical protein
MRRFRQRRREGALCVPVEIYVDEIEGLLDQGFIGPEHVRDRDAIGAAIANMVTHWVGSGARHTSWMKSNLLYHGTSAYRLAAIRKEGLLRISPTEKAVCLTPVYDVAVYWAELSSWSDAGDERGDGEGCVLALSVKALQRAGYSLTKIKYDEPFNEYAWEKEIACSMDVDITQPGILRDVQMITDAAECIARKRREEGQKPYLTEDERYARFFRLHGIDLEIMKSKSKRRVP